MVREATDICLRVLKESNKSRFDSFSPFEQCIDHIPYYLSGLSRAHFFRQPFSKQLYTPSACAGTGKLPLSVVVNTGRLPVRVWVGQTCWPTRIRRQKRCILRSTYYMAKSASGKDEANPMFWLATWADNISRLSAARNSSLYDHIVNLLFT